jgi:transmembrane sensor
MNTTETSHEINEAYLWRFFAGQATSEEKEILAQWVKKDELHRTEFQRVRELFYNTKYAPLRPKLNKKKAFERLQKTATKQSTIMLLFRPVMAVAAMVTIVFGIGLYFNVHKNVSNVESAIAFHYSTKNASYTLPDKSIVQLNKHSLVQYQTEITDKRAVSLVGEAYFDIKHNAARPFEIIAGTLKVRVLGTAFNVNARNLDSIVVSVTRGRVQLISLSDTSNSIILTIGQSACFVRNSFCSIQAFPQNVLAWKDRKLQFKATPLTDVIKNLSVYFDTAIVINSKEQNEQLTVKLKEPKLDSILQLLDVMYNLKRTNQNHTIVLQDNERN